MMLSNATNPSRITCRCCSWSILVCWLSVISMAAVMMSALVLAAVMFVIAVCAGWIARLGAALAGRVGVRRRQYALQLNARRL